MTYDNELSTPWILDFERDGTEDFGIIRDNEGDILIASHLPSTPLGDRTFQSGTFWFPEYDGDPVPRLVRQMKMMAAAPRLLALLKIAVATADPKNHKWVEEARDAIVQTTGLMYREEVEGKATRHLLGAAERLYAALEQCEAAMCDIFARCQQDGDEPSESEKLARKEAFAALCEARGEIAF